MRTPRIAGLMLVVLAVVASACTSSGPSARRVPTTSSSSTVTTPAAHANPPPVVLAGTAPAGWKPVDYGDAQVSVPANWAIVYPDSPTECPGPPAAGAIWLDITPTCPQTRSPIPVVQILPLGPPVGGPPSAQKIAPAAADVVINGIPARRVGLSSYAVPELGVTLVVSGAVAGRVLTTLTRSPAVAALAAGPAPAVPASWKWVTAGAVKVAVPGNWPTDHADSEGLFCGRPLFWADAVTLDSDQHVDPQGFCPVVIGPFAGPPANGVVVDLHPKTGWPLSTQLGMCVHLAGVTACPYVRSPSANEEMAELDILFVQITVPGKAGHELLEIGLAGNGSVARTILDSLRPA